MAPTNHLSLIMIMISGEGAACLIRAVEPLEDYETMHKLRQRKPKSNTANSAVVVPPESTAAVETKKRLKLHELANGPSKLCLAFGIQRSNCDKIDMVTSDELWLELNKDIRYLSRDFEIATSKRIGIDSTPPESRDKPWRFHIKDNFCESRAKVSEIKKRLGV
jgi:DNA-3-methyladenine glycosylase